MSAISNNAKKFNGSDDIWEIPIGLLTKDNTFVKS